MVRRLNAWSERQLPDDVFLEIVDLLYSALVPIVIFGVIAVGVGSLIAWRDHDALSMGLAVAMGAVSAGRALLVLWYRRARPAEAIGCTTARSWETRYAAGSFLIATLIGTFSARAFLGTDPVTHMLTTGLLFGYGSGVVARLSVRPKICIASLLLACAAPILAILSHLELAYAAHGLLLAAFLFGSFETVHFIHGAALGQLLRRREYAGLARLDPLTRLPNRLLLRERVAAALAEARHTGGMVALHCLDLDGFKSVNDQFGHPAGDALLEAVSRRLEGLLRSGDMAARLGGDEFVVLQTGLGHPDEAEMLARRIVRAIRAPFEIDGRMVRIGTGLGVALSPMDGDGYDQLIQCADAALYRAKNRGRDEMAFFEGACGPDEHALAS